MEKSKDREEKESNSATDKPWKYPGQVSQNSNFHSDPNVLEQEKQKKDIA